MTKVIYETQNAVFVIDYADATDTLKTYALEHKVDEAIELLKFIELSTKDPIVLPKEKDYFGFVILDLINKKGKGSVTCKLCNKTYPTTYLAAIVIGHGRSPLSLPKGKKGGIKRLLGKRRKMPGMFGGHGYNCPRGHKLISRITWRT